MKATSIFDKNKIKETICEWARLNVLMLVLMLLIRLAFGVVTYFRIDVDASGISAIMSGSIFDLITMLHIMCWGFVPFMILHMFLPKTARGISLALIFIYCIFSLLLNEYFCNTTMPLDQVIFAYSSEEIKGIIGASTSFSIIPILCFVLPAIAIIALAIVWKKVKINFIVATICIIISIIASISINYSEIIRKEKFYDNHRRFCLAINQPSYTIVKITDYIRISREWATSDGNMTDETRNAALKYQSLFPEKEYTNPDYPLYHKNNYEDVLGNLISPTSDGNPPNFVFIIVESLGQRLTGVVNPTVSFTPYIDSLKQCGLYWNNCLSASERTFGVLPAIFASAPYGEHGFIQIWEPIPNHNSLLKDMKSNGYSLSYYYGGVHEFDRYDIFLKLNNVDYIYKPEMTAVDSATYKILNDFHRWGIDDDELVRHAIEHRDTNPPQLPYTDIYMTLSTHEPFIFNEIDTYKQKVETILKSHADMPAKEKSKIQNNLDIYACFAYTDDCVRKLIDYYKTLPEYENTIFVITGDHRMGMLPLGVSLYSFNVPLIIYSPLIKSPRSMKAVVAHDDITPTLNAYLSKNYKYRTSNYCHWIGTTLDTAKQYRCNKKMAFMLNNREVVDYLNGEYYISRGETYKMEEDLYSTLIKSDAIHDKYSDELNNFNIVSRYVVKYNRLKPVENAEILYSKYIDFDTDSHEIFSRYVTEEKGNRYVSIGENVDFAPICPSITLEKEYKTITNVLKFDIKNIDTLRPLPNLVITTDDYYMSVPMLSNDGKSLNTGRMEHFETTITIPAGKSNRGKTIKYYLFNKDKANFLYDNISISIEAERQ